MRFDGLPSIEIENCIAGVPVNEGDLDGRPGDEVGLLPAWWTSCWHSYYVLGLRDGDWQYIVDPIGTHCSQWDDGADVIEKDERHRGRVLIRSTSMYDFLVRTQSVKVR